MFLSVCVSRDFCRVYESKVSFSSVHFQEILIHSHTSVLWQLGHRTIFRPQSSWTAHTKVFVFYYHSNQCGPIQEVIRPKEFWKLLPTDRRSTRSQTGTISDPVGQLGHRPVQYLIESLCVLTCGITGGPVRPCHLDSWFSTKKTPHT